MVGSLLKGMFLMNISNVRKYLRLTILALTFMVITVYGETGPAQSSQEKMQKLQQILSRAIKAESSTTDSESSLSTEELLSGRATPLVVSEPNSNKIASESPALTSTSVPDNNRVAGAEAKEAAVYDEAFYGAINTMIPMSPSQIMKLKEVYNESQLAAATPPGVPAKPTSSSVVVDLSPRATPPVIRLGAGFITSLVFVDGTGQPWPISSYSLGDPSAFNIQWDKKGNTLLVQSSTFYKRSNLAVILSELNTPIMITLLAGQEALDYRVDLRIPRAGPNAVMSQSGLPPSANPILLDVLNGIPPKDSKELKVIGGDCQAWLKGDKLYLRTNLNVISPGWQSIMSSVDGTHAYCLQPSPVILALQNGRDKVLTLLVNGVE